MAHPIWVKADHREANVNNTECLNSPKWLPESYIQNHNLSISFATWILSSIRTVFSWIYGFGVSLESAWQSFLTLAKLLKPSSISSKNCHVIFRPSPEICKIRLPVQYGKLISTSSGKHQLALRIYCKMLSFFPAAFPTWWSLSRQNEPWS